MTVDDDCVPTHKICQTYRIQLIRDGLIKYSIKLGGDVKQTYAARGGLHILAKNDVAAMIAYYDYTDYFKSCGNELIAYYDYMYLDEYGQNRVDRTNIEYGIRCIVNYKIRAIVNWVHSIKFIDG